MSTTPFWTDAKHFCLDCNRETLPVGVNALPRRCPKCGRRWQYAETNQALAGTETAITDDKKFP